MIHTKLVVFILFSVYSSFSFSLEREKECLAKNIYYEARDQSIIGKFAVAFVTLNRVKSSKYPKTICEVVWQKHQFSWTHDGKPDNPYELEKYEVVKALTNFLLENLDTYQDPTKGSLYYHAKYVSPCWSKLSKPVISINDHIFYNNLVGSPCIK